MDGSLGWLQWPAMVVTVIAAWLVGSTSTRRRSIAFWTFLASNVLWITWGWVTQAHALVALQFFLAALNIRGAMKNETATEAGRHGQAAGYPTTEAAPAQAGQRRPDDEENGGGVRPPRRAGQQRGVPGT